MFAKTGSLPRLESGSSAELDDQSAASVMRNFLAAAEGGGDVTVIDAVADGTDQSEIINSTLANATFDTPVSLFMDISKLYVADQNGHHSKKQLQPNVGQRGQALAACNFPQS